MLDIRRRQFITLLAGAAAGPLAAHAQQPGKVHRIGFLWENPNTFPDALEAFRQELRRLGYTETPLCRGTPSSQDHPERVRRESRLEADVRCAHPSRRAMALDQDYRIRTPSDHCR
jgi:hypothetical protein